MLSAIQASIHYAFRKTIKQNKRERERVKNSRFVIFVGVSIPFDAIIFRKGRMMTRTLMKHRYSFRMESYRIYKS